MLVNIFLRTCYCYIYLLFKLGGLAGGEKYIVFGILFKFALDVHHIFGNDYRAAKVAGTRLHHASLG